MQRREQIREARDFIAARVPETPEIGLILGSGLGDLAEKIASPVSIPYGEIPHFPVSTVAGHAGRLVCGRLKGKRVIAMQGRFHYYEGHPLEAVVFPVRVMRVLGIKVLIVTNAAGGINLDYRPGDLVLIRDHLNLAFRNPLIGPNDDELGPRFPDMSAAYDPELRAVAQKAAAEQGIDLKEGVYGWVTGPSYETPAEIRMYRILGADMVGMSTVPEVLAARHGGLRVLGISCISNMAAGILPQPLTHEEVLETTERIKEKFAALVEAVVEKIGEE